MTLEEHIGRLPKVKQFSIAIHLTRLALPIWEAYAAINELTYQDTVVGLQHFVDKNLLKSTVDAVAKYILANKATKKLIRATDLLSLEHAFRDPIVSLQDTDWELPHEVERTFYAVYNLLEAVLGVEKTTFKENILYVVINQAVDALDSSKLLTEAALRAILYETTNSK